MVQELRELTASEPLSLEEEYAMQRSWRIDRDKLTFIVCLPTQGFRGMVDVVSMLDDPPHVMVGDVNLFLFKDDATECQEYSDVTTESTTSKRVIGEVEIMIARGSSRRQGVGYRALSMFLQYVLEQHQEILREYSSEPSKLAHLLAKIDAENEPSIALFKKAGFVKVSEEPNYFGEVEMRWDMDQADRKRTVLERAQRDSGMNGQRTLRYVAR